MPSLVDIKTKARRSVHERAAVPCEYVDQDHPAGLAFAEGYAGSGLTVRYLTKLDTTGDLDGNYGEIIDGIDRLVFSDENLAEVSAALVDNGQAPLVLQRAATVTIPAYKGLRFVLDTREPPDGPLETTWSVARKRG